MYIKFKVFFLFMHLLADACTDSVVNGAAVNASGQRFLLRADLMLFRYTLDPSQTWSL